MKDINKTKKQLIKELEEIRGKLAEKVVRENEEKPGLEQYRFLLESFTDGVLIIDQEWRYLALNDKVVRIVQMPKEKLVGNKMTDLFPGVEETVFGKTYKQVLETGELATASDEFTFPDGRKVWYEVHVYSIPVGLLITVVDITKRKRSEEELREYKYIVSSSTDMLALLDKHFTYLAANKAYMDAFKVTSGDLIGNTVSKVFGEEFFNTVIKPNAERCLAGEEINYQDWFYFPAYEPRYMDITYYQYTGIDNEIKGFVVNGRNITERKLAEEDLKKHHDHLEELVEDRTEELQKTINLMTGREVRMADLKEVIQKLRAQLESAGITPVADDPIKNTSVKNSTQIRDAKG